MVNFRFHLVSLTAVFLALAAGIAIGAGVVDRQTVDFLDARVKTVEKNREETNAQNDELRTQLGQWERFSAEAGERMVEGRLTDVPVVVLAVVGTDDKSVDALDISLQAAGARLQGELWFTKKWALSEPDDVRRLSELVGEPFTGKPAELRAKAIEQLFTSWVGGRPADALLPLRDAAFLEYQPPAGSDLVLESVALVGSETVVVSEAKVDTPPVDLAVPVVGALAARQVPVLAASPTRAKDGKQGDPATLAAAVRDEDDIAGRVSTVDNVDDYKGRVAAVLALAELRNARTGHYGVDDGAQRIIPEPQPR